MPAPATVDDFLEVVRKSRQIDTSRLDAYVLERQSNASLPADPRQLAALLVREGLLTSFQAEQFLLGKYKGFHLGGYRLLERLGAGGTGTVFLAEHEVMKRKVALKILPPHVAQDTATLERFRREAQAAAALDHPHIVRAYDFRQEGTLHFLVMEYVNGPSLQEIIQQQGGLPTDLACAYVRQAALGLAAAHEAGIVHRDIKPGNLLVDSTGIVKILDLGLARFAPDGQESLTKKFDENMVMGTADYLAPEQALSLHDVDHRADIYSLGATLYALLSGEPPFHQGTVTQKLLWHQMRDPKPIRTLRPDVPEEVAQILATMMEKAPEARYQSARELAEVLAPFCADTPAPIPPTAICSNPETGLSPSKTRSGSPSTRRHRTPANADTVIAEPERLRRDLPLPPDEPATQPIPDIQRSDAALAGVLILGAVMGGIFLLVGGIVAFLLWSPRPAGTATGSNEIVTRPIQEQPVPPPFRLPDHVGELFRLPPAHTGGVERVAFSPEGNHVYSAGADRIIRQWDLVTRSQTGELRGHAGTVTYLSLSRKQPRLLSAGADATARLWDLPGMRERTQFVGHRKRVWCAVFSPNERQVLTGGEDNLVRLYNADTGKPIRSMKGHTAPVNSVAYRPAGPRQGLSASWDHTIRVWNLDNGKSLRLLKGHTNSCSTVAYLPEGVRALSGSYDGTVRLWNTENGKLLHTYTGHEGHVWIVAVSSDGRRALSGGADGKIRLWDLPRRRLVRVFTGHDRGVPGLAFSPDGRHFVSGSLDGSVRIWGIPAEK